MSSTLKNGLVFLFVLVLIALGYFMIIQRNAGTLSFTSVSAVSGDLLLSTQIFIDRRAELEARTLDLTLFTDERFTSLRTYATPIPDQLVGRTNLFDAPTDVPPPGTVPVE